MTTTAQLSSDDTGDDRHQPAIVLLPGLTFDRRIWAPVVETLRRRDPSRRVVALDLPGHGESPARLPHDLPRVVELIHDALVAAEVGAPVIVGHSMAGALATLYAARHETAAVVSVDQLPAIAPFAQMLRSVEPQLRGPAFARTWRDTFATSFHLELLAPPMRQLVESNSRVSQELVLSYWDMALTEPLETLESLVDTALAEIGRRGVPYVLVLGDEAPSAVIDGLRSRIPTLALEVWAGTGHFPHLARPHEFVDVLLRATAYASL